MTKSVAVLDSCEIWRVDPVSKTDSYKSDDRKHHPNCNAKCLIEYLSEKTLAIPDEFDVVFLFVQF